MILHNTQCNCSTVNGSCSLALGLGLPHTHMRQTPYQTPKIPKNTQKQTPQRQCQAMLWLQKWSYYYYYHKTSVKTTILYIYVLSTLSNIFYDIPFWYANLIINSTQKRSRPKTTPTPTSKWRRIHSLRYYGSVICKRLAVGVATKLSVSSQWSAWELNDTHTHRHIHSYTHTQGCRPRNIWKYNIENESSQN